MKYNMNGSKGLTVGDIQKAIGICMTDAEEVVVHAENVDLCVLDSGNVQVVFVFGDYEAPHKTYGMEISPQEIWNA